MSCRLDSSTPPQPFKELDDVIIYSATFDQHLADIRDVLDRLIEAGLKLGHVASRHGIHPDPAKIAAVVDMPVPHFGDIAHPLHRLTAKSVEFSWNSDCQAAFEEHSICRLMHRMLDSELFSLRKSMAQINRSPMPAAYSKMPKPGTVQRSSKALDSRSRLTIRHSRAFKIQKSPLNG